MSEADDPCEPFRELRDSLYEQADQLEDSLSTLPPDFKTDVFRAEIKRLRAEAHQEHLLYQACLAANQPKTPPRAHSNLGIVGVEKTQATQFFLFNGRGCATETNSATGTVTHETNNSVPMVAGKTTVLRVYVNCQTLAKFPAIASVTGTVSIAPLNVFGVPDPPIATFQPFNGPIPPNPSSSINRSIANHTLNFRIPGPYCAGDVAFIVTVFDPAHPGDPAYASNPFTLNSSFEIVPDLQIHGVLINYTGPAWPGPGNANLDAPTGLDLVSTLDFVYRTYPVANINYTGCTTQTFSGNLMTGGPGCGSGWSDLMDLLWNLRVASNTNDIYVALLPAQTPTATVIGCGGNGRAAGYVGNGIGREGVTFAQEIAHAFMRKHAPCGGPKNVDPDFPTYDMFPAGSIGEFGFDSVNARVFDPTFARDYMTYCGPSWTSPYTYVALKTAITTTFTSPDGNRPSVRDFSREFLHLHVRVHREGSVELRSAFHLYGPPPSCGLIGRKTFYACDLLDDEGNVIGSYPLHDDCPYHCDDDYPAHVEFRESIPWHHSVSSIRFLRKGKTIHTLRVEDKAPTVRMLPPDISERSPEIVRLSWIVEPTEGEAKATVRYSADGGRSWRAVAANVTEPQVVINRSLLPGGEECMFQVAVSAGIRTALDHASVPAVPRRPRAAHIISPRPGEVFAQRDSIRLLGGAFSPDTGAAAPGEITWTSNRDGPLGTGPELILSDLSVGQHRISLSAFDGLGDEASTSIFITIRSRTPCRPGEVV